MPLSMPYVQANGTPGVYGANTWFSLWTANTAIDLFSAGGNGAHHAGDAAERQRRDLPSQLSAVAANGSIYYKTPVLLAPGPAGRLDLLAGDSIYGGNAPLMRSGASLDTLASPYRPPSSAW